MNSELLPRVLIAGGTGYIGGGVLEVLHQKGFWVRGSRSVNLCISKHLKCRSDYCWWVRVKWHQRNLVGECQQLCVTPCPLSCFGDARQRANLDKARICNNNVQF
jgi:hypothetical protein